MPGTSPRADTHAAPRAERLGSEAPKHPFTVDDFHRMGELGILDRDERVELVDGEVVEMTPIGSPHAGCVNWLLATLTRCAGPAGVVTAQNPVVLGEYTELYPDLALLRPRDDYYRRSHPRPADVLLVVEVADTTLAYDQRIKVPRYARAEIREVWVVDLQGRVVHVYRQPAAGRYQEHSAVGPGESLQVPISGAPAVAVDDLLG